ncbi:DUF4011 domain-containing protein [Paenarthrobacter sp. Z7-10]|uniref:DUF4011 domain-containing protein n=1 Tax=Paenarthrobacter sp. Z7-10 TaxID=2787635 RepID=UPI0022A9A16F|nr:DUF4011 domain-containing protein [Paenarthrobacter sp. Z7-10]MCZ2404347.1 DUF4011 domain-containing protein [Paenarthrobacter sp. Z7-10]
MPVWSRSFRASAEKKAHVSEEVSHSASSEELRTWLAGLGPYSGPDTLLVFTKTPEGCIDLTHAHPSGLAQLLAGRRTRLSTLIRDAAQFAVAVRAARTLRSKIFEMNSDRGIDVGYLAAGTASWTNTGDTQPHHVSAPVLLTAVALTARPGEDDYELALTEQARINPALVRNLREAHGVTFDPPALARLAYSTARFDPAPVLERLRSLILPIKGARVEHHLLVSSFADLSENMKDPALLAGNDFLAALSRSTSSSTGDDADVAQEPEEERFPPLDARAPQEEVLVLDADTRQQRVLDMVRAGDSLVVSTPPGTGATQTAINAIATLVHEGKSVLVVGERRATLNELAQRFSGLGLESLLLQLSAQAGPDQLKAQLVRAIVRNEGATAPNLENLHRTLVEYRHQLVDHLDSLHNVRKRWGCSPYQAMQSLAQLTSIHPAPATTVRLKRSVLDNISDRDELAGRLHRAAELGSFSKAATNSPWHGARLVTRKETEEAHALAAVLLERLPAFRTKMNAVADYAEIQQATSVPEWGEQLELLVAVRGSLDKFTPDIFDRPVTDLISATASSSWRREHKVDMAAMQRSRLRRVAKEYIRPGVHISDLHNSLVLVQEQRALWADNATTVRHPAVPSGLADLQSGYAELNKELVELSVAVERTAQGGKLEALGYEALIGRLRALVADKETLQTLPERTLLLESMREHGLGELLDDLAEREVAPEHTRAELDLAWWQSALEAMISGDDYLAMSDGDSLRKLEAEYRLADEAHVASGSARLRWELGRKWQQAVAGRNRQAESLRHLLKDGPVTLDLLTTQASDLLTNLVPVWTASPLVLPAVIPAGHRFDAVVILDAESTSLHSALPALARGTQIVAFGDEQTAAPQGFSVALERVIAGEEQQQRLHSVFTTLAKVLPQQRLTMSYRAVDEDLVLQLGKSFYDDQLERMPDGSTVTGLHRSLVVEYLPDGTGLPGTGTDGVESVGVEVNRVVDLVFEHARMRPRSSLAVITASERHANRVAQAIRMQMPNHPLLAEFFTSGAESFRVVTVERAAGVVRDHVIFSLGYGRTPHGRALHNFGPLSAEDGRGKFALAMTRAREQLHVLTCFRPEDLDVSRLNNGARDFYELLDRELAGHSLLGSTASRGATSEQSLGDDPLVSDLANRLRARGARVWQHYDGVIDVVAAVDPMHNLHAGEDEVEVPTPAAVESDGTLKYRSLSVRERSRLRPQLLEKLGWRYVPLWTIEVFTDPSACAERIGSYLGLPPAPGGNDHPTLKGNPLDTGVPMSGQEHAGPDSRVSPSVLDDRVVPDTESGAAGSEVAGTGIAESEAAGSTAVAGSEVAGAPGAIGASEEHRGAQTPGAETDPGAELAQTASGAPDSDVLEGTVGITSADGDQPHQDGEISGPAQEDDRVSAEAALAGPHAEVGQPSAGKPATEAGQPSAGKPATEAGTGAARPNTDGDGSAESAAADGGAAGEDRTAESAAADGGAAGEGRAAEETDAAVAPSAALDAEERGPNGSDSEERMAGDSTRNKR